jgi:ubiquinone/menaquinone biosynthesis C-methylase UbiE
MKKVVKIGKHFVSDFISDGDVNKRKKYNLDLFLDENIGAARLNDLAPPETMWGKYWYRSGINKSMTIQLEEIVKEIASRVSYKDGDVWLDIACNDGTMFKFIPSQFVKLGIDPADDTYVEESSKLADKIVQDYFSEASYAKTGIGDKKAKVITTIAMFYDLDDPNPFIQDINKVLDDDGIWVIQLSYTPLMIEQLAFDNICHEHVYYYSLNSLSKLLGQHDLKIVDASLNDTNGGSVRVYIQKNVAKESSFATAPMRDVCRFRVNSLLEYENKKYDISKVKIWKKFQQDIEDLKKQTVDFIKAEKAKGKVICGYGASTKGNTLLQWFGLDESLITAIAERSPYKFGLKTVGTNIPILSEEEVRNLKPDYMLVLPWHFINEFVEREQDYLNSGGKFIVPCPKFKIYEK